MSERQQCWVLGLATGCILSGTVRTAPLIPLIKSLELFWFFVFFADGFDPEIF